MSSLESALMINILFGSLPVAFILGDSILLVLGHTKLNMLAVTTCKLCYTSIILSFASYLYFYKGQMEKTSYNIVDLVTGSVIIVLLMFIQTLLIVKIKNDQENEENKKVMQA